MAKQKGIIKLDGTIGGITFYKSTQDGYLAREKGGVSAEKIANDPAFQRTRENGEEFGRAGKAGKLLRNAIRAMLQNASDSRMVGRLTQKMVEVIQEDLTNPRGPVSYTHLDVYKRQGYFPIQKIQVTDVSRVSADWATNSQQD